MKSPNTAIIGPKRKEFDDRNLTTSVKELIVEALLRREAALLGCIQLFISLSLLLSDVTFRVGSLPQMAVLARLRWAPTSKLEVPPDDQSTIRQSDVGTSSPPTDISVQMLAAAAAADRRPVYPLSG